MGLARAAQAMGFIAPETLDAIEKVTVVRNLVAHGRGGELTPEQISDYSVLVDRLVADAPLVVYLHGGYWQWGGRALYGFLAESVNAAGIDVAIPSYPLCPAVTVFEIMRDLRDCMKAIWRRTGVRPLAVGHSAGGHLASAMLATDWTVVPGVPHDLVGARSP
jgi:acetyl esterase/lipase